MNIAVLGTGTVGQTIAARLFGLGHEVVVGTRDPQATLARTEPDGMGNPPYAAWAADHAGVSLATFADAAAEAELVVNATSGHGALPALEAAGADNLAGKVVLDISNPLDFSNGFPPTLSVSNTDSLGEQLQRAFPEARVVKALNTLNADLMVHPQTLGASSTVFVSGDDAAAKATVTDLLTSFGHDDVIDLGGLETAFDGSRPVRERLLEVGDDPLLDREEQQAEDDQRQDDLDRVRDERVELVLFLSRKGDQVHGLGPSSGMGQRTNARAIPMIASASASAKPRMAIDCRRPWASG